MSDAEAIAEIPRDSPEYAKAYERGWRAGASTSGTALEAADHRNEPHAWYDGYTDRSAGRPKWKP